MINKIYYIIKKCYKIVFIIGFVFMVLARLSGGVFASTNYYDNDANYSQDPTYLIKTDYDNLCNKVIKSLLQTNNSPYSRVLANWINDRGNIYIIKLTDVTYRIYLIYDDNASNFINTHIGLNNYTNVPTVSGEMHYAQYLELGWYRDEPGNFAIKNYNVGGSRFIPTTLIGYTNENLFKWASWKLGKADADTLAGLLTVIAGDTGDMSEKMGEMVEQQKETNDFLKDESDSGVDYSVPSSSATDTTESAFDGIFTRFYNAMTNNSSVQSISFPIPFTSQNIVLRSDLTSTIVNGFPGSAGALKALLNSVWYFLVGLYILKDIAHIIQDIKGGDIMTKQDENIKTTML